MNVTLFPEPVEVFGWCAAVFAAGVLGFFVARRSRWGALVFGTAAVIIGAVAFRKFVAPQDASDVVAAVYADAQKSIVLNIGVALLLTWTGARRHSSRRSDTAVDE
jgi:Na+/phosphate symporter